MSMSHVLASFFDIGDNGFDGASITGSWVLYGYAK